MKMRPDPIFNDPISDWKASDSWRNQRIRAEVLRRTRSFFESRDFLEVETPLLSGEVVVEAHIDPVAVTLPDDARTPERGRAMWLQAGTAYFLDEGVIFLANGAKQTKIGLTLNGRVALQ